MRALRHFLSPLSALGADVVFSWRQLKKHRTASAAAVLSLALAIGSATATFRLADAVILRDLPVAEPGRLFYVGAGFEDRNGFDYREFFDYQAFERYRDLVLGSADVMVVGRVASHEVTFSGADATELAYLQQFSGNVFPIFGLRPALGRLLLPSDDTGNARVVAVLSYAFWSDRFGRDPKVIGQTFRSLSKQIEIVGVAPKGFKGTGPGEEVDVFLGGVRAGGRIWLRPKEGVALEEVRQPLQVAYDEENQALMARLPADSHQQTAASMLRRPILLLPAASGASLLRKDYRRPLSILGILVALVLLVACVNVANLLTAQAAARKHEMALRVALGAQRGRLVQLVLVEGAMLAGGASVLGAAFAHWAAPFITSLLATPSEPLRLSFETGWRELAFSAALAVLVTLVFSLAPALKASALRPNHALKGDEDPRSRRRLMKGLLAAQLGFCVFVLFVAGLFINTFEGLAGRPLGFDPANVVLTTILSKQPEPPTAETWRQVTEHLSEMPGVKSASWGGFAMLSGVKVQYDVRAPGREAGTRQPYFASVSSGFFDTMRIGRIAGRDLTTEDPSPLDPDLEGGVGIVNESFARRYFDGENPVGRSVFIEQGEETAPMEIVGYVRDAAHFDLREEMSPVVYVPAPATGRAQILLVRADVDPGALLPMLEREVSRVQSGLSVLGGVVTQQTLVRQLLLRERLLAVLSSFFAVLALLLAAIGLYGVLHYLVSQRRREISIRIALGAGRFDVVQRMAGEVGWLVTYGSAAGIVAGVLCERLVGTMLYGVRALEINSVAAPIVALAVAALLAALPATHRAASIDPARTLRTE